MKNNEQAAKRRGVSLRDPPEKRKRPYERYAARKMSRLALRRLALQSIGRPDVAQGPLHDTLLEMMPDYADVVESADRMAFRFGTPQAIVLGIGALKTRTSRFVNPFFVTSYRSNLEHTVNEGRALAKSASPYVVTYIATREKSFQAHPTRRDPSEKRKRPHERHTHRVMDKRVLRRMALQSIRRPEVAQGPLHDALIEMYPEEYVRMIRQTEAEAQETGHKMAIVMEIRGLWRKERSPVLTSTRKRFPLFYSRLFVEQRGLDEDWRSLGLSPRVITYVTRAGKAVVFPEDIP